MIRPTRAHVESCRSENSVISRACTRHQETGCWTLSADQAQSWLCAVCCEMGEAYGEPWSAVGVDVSDEYCDIARQRLAVCEKTPKTITPRVAESADSDHGDAGLDGEMLADVHAYADALTMGAVHAGHMEVPLLTGYASVAEGKA